MWYVALSRRDFDDAVQWGTRQFERAHRRQDAGNYLWGLCLRVLAWSYLGRYDDARMTADELERHFGPDPAPPLVWGVCFCQGTACACDDPPIAVELFERARDNALAAGLPFLAHVCRRDPPLLAAKAARDVLVDMWEDRDLFDIRIAVAHIMTVCVRAARLREAAIIDGWLGSDAIPLAPHYVARLATARSEIDAHLGDDATALRSQGAAWPPATIVEHMLTTLTSIAEGDEPPQTIRVSLPVQ
jgi:hypothetical protein